MENVRKIILEKLVTNMDNILAQEGGLQGVGTGCVIFKIMSEWLFVLDILKTT